jgi:hypothetical protein
MFKKITNAFKEDDKLTLLLLPYPLFAPFHTVVAPPRHPIFALFPATATTNIAASIEETIDLTHPFFSTPPMCTASNNVMNGTISAFDLTVPVAASAASEADIASAYVVVGVTEVRILLICCR